MDKVKFSCTAIGIGSNWNSSCEFTVDTRALDFHSCNLLLLNQKLLFCHICSATSGGILDRAIDAEDRKHGDFMRLVNFLRCCSIVLALSADMHVLKRIVNGMLVNHSGPCGRVLGACSKDQIVLCQSSVHVGCRVLHQGRRWCTCKYRCVWQYVFWALFLPIANWQDSALLQQLLETP
jgi:hypothetical protein